MIKVGKEYFCGFPREVKGNKVVFSIGNKRRDNSGTDYVSVMCENTFNGTLIKGDKVIIEKISGADTSEYQGKTQLTLFCDVRLANAPIVEPNKEFEDFIGTAEIKEDDLPF